MSKLEEELRKEQEARRLAEQGVQPEPDKPKEKTKQEELNDAEAEFKLIQKNQDIESIKIGFASLKAREAANNTRVAELDAKQKAIEAEKESFVKERAELFDSYEKHMAEYNNLMALVKTKEENADKLTKDALQKKANADRIIKAQTEAEKIEQEQQEAADQNMDDALNLLYEMSLYLKRQEDSKAYNLGLILGLNLSTIKRLDHNKSLKTLVDLVTIDCARIYELAEYLQDSKKDYPRQVDYLLKCTDWLEEKLLIGWVASTDESPLR